VKRFIVLAAILLAAAVGVGSWWLLGRDSGDDVAAFFTLPTPTVCESGALSVDVSNAHFAAFSPGRVLAETSDKFLVADIAVRNDGAAVATVSEDNFFLTERPGEQRSPAALVPSAKTLSAALDPGATLSGTLAFSVPPSLGAAKLLFDDGCSHQEWLVP
jgi:hypothetical protein